MPANLPRLALKLACAALAVQAFPALAQAQPASRDDAPALLREATFADLATLADSAPLVVRATVRKMARVEDARAPGLTPGMGRFYVDADTRSLLTGSSPIGQSFAYLVDLPLDARGKPPTLKKQDVLLFARPVAGRPGELQLVTPTAQQLWSEQVEARVRSLLKALVSPDAPARITGVRELLFVPGNLAGQGETQIFLSTESGSAASITVVHEPGTVPAWGVSFSELVADIGHPPKPETLEWYRLACSLPANPPQRANVSEGVEAMKQAAADYRMVLNQLGPCVRNPVGR
ncbi:hypothetical protein EDF56_104264 [Novosphingobium sp. PhB165]|uniref:hypothetical protein n=1 Tax=Novosphingobium sp. PhB165 TaxID=2485105 RepID=UPI001051876B|nr:hypothetical protein [Novosphingobium sp. PhB165]TCM18732.1 hypothetical protein EDF56_104264 [Novosphingobium sp. PhB165]